MLAPFMGLAKIEYHSVRERTLVRYLVICITEDTSINYCDLLDFFWQYREISLKIVHKTK